MIEKNVSDTEAGKSVSKLIDVSSVPKEGRYYAIFFNNTELKALAEAIDGAVLEELNIELELRALNRDRIRTELSVEKSGEEGRGKLAEDIVG